MDDLIEALQLVRPYMGAYGVSYPTHCEHDVMYLNVEPSGISPKDLERLDELSFVQDPETDMLVSYRFGSC